MEIKHEKKDDVVLSHSFVNAKGKVKTEKSKKWMRTCMACNENFYSREEFKEHMTTAHNKRASKALMEGTRKVDTSHQKNRLDVPEEVLVKSRKVEEPKPQVANSRKRRKASEDKTETVEEPKQAEDSKASEAPKEEKPKAAPKKRGRRKKAADK